MPDRREGEDRGDFISRCMADAEALADFPETDQRFAFCNSQADKGSERMTVNEIIKIIDPAEVKLTQHFREEGGNLVYDTSNFSEESQQTRVVDSGVSVVSRGTNTFVSSFVFDASFDRESATTWLSEVAGIEVPTHNSAHPDEEEEEELTARVHSVILSAPTSKVQLTAHDSVDEESGLDILIVECTAVTSGTWNDLIYPLDVIHKALPLMNKPNHIPIVEEHEFGELGDGKGWVLSARIIPTGIAAKFAVHDPGTIAKIKNGVKNAVSVHFLVKVQNGAIKEFTKMMELTVCAEPACPHALINNTKDVAISLDAKTTSGKEWLQITGDATATTASIDSPIVIKQSRDKMADEVNESSVLKAENESLQSKLTLREKDVEEKESKLSDLEAQIEKLQAEKLANSRLSAAKEQSTSFIKAGKLIPANEDLFQEIFITLSDTEQKKMVELFENRTPVVEVGEESFGKQFEAPADMTVQEQATLLAQQALSYGKAQFHENRYGHLPQEGGQ